MNPTGGALLRIEGPVADFHHHAAIVRIPPSTRSILSIAQKLEQLAPPRSRPMTHPRAVIEGVGRAFCAGGDLQTIGCARPRPNTMHRHNPVVGDCCEHYHGHFHRPPAADAEDSADASVHGSGRPAPASSARLCRRSLHCRRQMPASRRLMPRLGVSPDGGGTCRRGRQRRPTRRRANLQHADFLLAEDSFRAASRRTRG